MRLDIMQHMNTQCKNLKIKLTCLYSFFCVLLFCWFCYEFLHFVNKKKLKRFKENFLKSYGIDGNDLNKFEELLWSFVENGCVPFVVEYGSEIPSNTKCTGILFFCLI